MKREFIIMASSFIVMCFLKYINYFDIVCYLLGIMLGITSQHIKD